jgi:Ca2+/Na+ antiporter
MNKDMKYYCMIYLFICYSVGAGTFIAFLNLKTLTSIEAIIFLIFYFGFVIILRNKWLVKKLEGIKCK